jgi:hypothetical protein
VRDCVAAKLDIRAGVGQMRVRRSGWRMGKWVTFSKFAVERLRSEGLCCRVAGEKFAYFLLMKYRNALPNVWSSFSTWKEAAWEVAPGS